jgi:hypothetical protein
LKDLNQFYAAGKSLFKASLKLDLQSEIKEI